MTDSATTRTLPALAQGRSGRDRRCALLLAGIVALALIGLVAAMQRPFALSLSPASTVFDHASTDWNASERTTDGMAFRWTTEESSLNFRAARRILPANKRLILTMRFAARPTGAPVTTVTLLANGTMVDAWSSNVEHPVRIDVTALLRQHDELHLTVRVDQPYTPPRDKRQLGVASVAEAQLAALPGKQLPSPDAAISVVVLVLLAALAAGRRASLEWRLGAAALAACAVTLGVLLARVSFWRAAMPLELSLGLLVILLWAPVWWAALRWPVDALRVRTRLDDRALVLGGFVIALPGEVIVAQHRGTTIGAALLAVGILLALAGLLPTLPASQGEEDTGDGVRAPLAGVTRGATWHLVALLGIAAVAVALRVALLADMPASLFRDEARHALHAARILDDPSYRPLFEPDIYLPALFLYQLALVFKLFGVSALALRMFMALVGVGDVLLLFLIGRRLFGPRAGLIAAYLFAVGFWAFRVQRLGFAQSFAGGLVLFALYLFIVAMQSGRWGFWALAGAGAAGSVYGYYSGYFVPIVIAVVACFLLWSEPRRFVRYWLPRFALCGGVCIAVVAPLMRYIATHPDQYFLRSRQTALFAETNLRQAGADRLAAFEANIPPNLGMYTVRGDFEPKHNLPNAPNLDAISAVFLLIGVPVALAGARRGRRALPMAGRPPPGFGIALVFIWLGVMLVPSLLAVDVPNTFRAFDTLPPVLLLAALGAEAIWARLITPSTAGAEHEAFGLSLANNGTRRAGGNSRMLAILASVTLLTTLALNAGTYFGLMRHDARETFRFDTYFASQAGARMVTEAGATPGMTFFVPRETIDRDVFPFFARVMNGTGTVRPLESVDPATLPARYAILLPNGRLDAPPDRVLGSLPWAQGLQRLPGNSPAGAGGVPAFIEYRTPG